MHNVDVQLSQMSNQEQ